MVKPISVRLTADQRDTVEALADARNLSMSDIARVLVDAGLSIDQAHRELLGEEFQDMIGQTVQGLVTDSLRETIVSEVRAAIRETVTAKLVPLLDVFSKRDEELRNELETLKKELGEVRTLATQKRGLLS